MAHDKGQADGRSPGESKRVLLVEDDEVSRKLAIILLKKSGFDVIIAENGKQAVGIYEKEPLDLILMDINMPEMDGFTATMKIREMEKQANLHTHIIAMTAYAQKGDREKVLEFGMDDYISKPINFKEFNETIDKWVFKR